MKGFGIAFAAAISISAAGAPLWAQAVIPVSFPTGQTGTTITDRIVGNDYKDYWINLRAGQVLSVNLRTLRGSPYFNIIEPNGGDVAIYVGSTSGPQTELRTNMTGNYTIRVYQMRATGRRGEVASYRLSIDANGTVAHPHAPRHMAGDALVSGTPYHAVAPITCRTVMGGPMGTCRAGVIRRSPASATVHLDTPDGGERTILFRDGRAVSSDANAPFRVDRNRDTSIIRIGAVEIYEIPDALPFGG